MPGIVTIYLNDEKYRFLLERGDPQKIVRKWVEERFEQEKLVQEKRKEREE